MSEEDGVVTKVGDNLAETNKALLVVMRLNTRIKIKIITGVAATTVLLIEIQL